MACSKISYTSRGHAKAELRSMKRSQVRVTSAMRVYVCDACGYWHVGTGVSKSVRKRTYNKRNKSLEEMR
jgi:rubrerythrin